MINGENNKHLFIIFKWDTNFFLDHLECFKMSLEHFLLTPGMLVKTQIPETAWTPDLYCISFLKLPSNKVPQRKWLMAIETPFHSSAS